MIRQKLDEYLDGGLAPADRAKIEQAVACDRRAATLLAQMKSERALRSAALASYAPSEAEAKSLASSMLAACREQEHAPVGRIGIWVKRSLGVAAGIALLCGAFALGRVSAPHTATPMAAVESNNTTVASASYYVLYNDENGEPQMKEFASVDDAMAFQKQSAHESVALASGFDAEHPGSF